jgi:hypothetical protein
MPAVSRLVTTAYLVAAAARVAFVLTAKKRPEAQLPARLPAPPESPRNRGPAAAASLADRDRERERERERGGAAAAARDIRDRDRERDRGNRGRSPPGRGDAGGYERGGGYGGVRGGADVRRAGGRDGSPGYRGGAGGRYPSPPRGGGRCVTFGFGLKVFSFPLHACMPCWLVLHIAGDT